MGVGDEILSLHFVPFQNDQRAAGGVLAGASIRVGDEIASAVSHRWRVSWRGNVTLHPS